MDAVTSRRNEARVPTTLLLHICNEGSDATLLSASSVLKYVLFAAFQHVTLNFPSQCGEPPADQVLDCFTRFKTF